MPSLNLIIYLCGLCAFILGQPQCPDFSAPIKPQPSLSFCTEYQELSCCNAEQDSEIQAEYESIQSTEPARILAKCGDRLKEVMCTRCNPYAARIFDTENNPANGLDFPGLCADYCKEFYRDCYALLPYLTDDTALWRSTQDQFCPSLKLSDPAYCFPAVSQCTCLQQVTGDLNRPVGAYPSRTNPNVMYVLEQHGIVNMYDTKLPGLWSFLGTFLDIQDRVVVSDRWNDERGLLGLAFHPQFETNRRFYVYYTGVNEGAVDIRLSEFTAISDSKGNPTSEKILITANKPSNYGNHNSGMLMFGSDGMLYITVGDGGGGGDKFNLAQNKSSFLGKMLRIDVSVAATDTQKYRIPTDNPFTQGPDSLKEIFAYGLRNSWRCAADRGQLETGETCVLKFNNTYIVAHMCFVLPTKQNRGRLFCGDVGQSGYEEINIVENGGNYGWSATEGLVCYKSTQCASLVGDIQPIFAYDRSVGVSVAGGYFYRGCKNAYFNDSYIFADTFFIKFFRLKQNAEGNWANAPFDMCPTEICSAAGLTNTYAQLPVAFAEDYQAELYVMGRDYNGDGSGQIYKFVDPISNGPEDCNFPPQM